MELMPDFAYVRPETVDEALAAKAAHPDARFVAGGTDLLPNTRRGLVATTTMIDLTACAGLGEIVADDSGTTIGAAVTLAELAGSDLMAARLPAVSAAADAVAGPTQRAMATVGGNLCLDTRCIFYNQSEWWRASNAYCLKYRGETCHVVLSSKRCYAAYSGDLAAALLVYDAEVEIAGPNGHRRIPVDQLWRDDGIDYLALDADELVTAVHMAWPSEGTLSGYRKLRVRQSIDFPLAGVAAAVDTAETRLILGITGTNSRPIRLDASDLVGRDNYKADLDARVRKAVSPVRTGLIQPQYRRRAVAAAAVDLVARLREGGEA